MPRKRRSSISSNILSNISSKFVSKLDRLSYLPATFQLIWQAARYWTLAWVILLLLQGLLPAATVYLTRMLVDGLVAVVGAGISWQAVQPALLPILLMAATLLLTEVLQNLMDWVRTGQAELVQDHISGLVHEKSYTVDFAFYESSDYYDRLSRATSDASGQSLSLIENVGSLLQNSITLVAMVAILLPYGIWLPGLLLISTLPAFYVMLRLNRHYHRWWEQTTTDRRRLQYYELLLTNNAPAAEIRVFNLGPYFESAYQRLRRRLRRERMQLAKQQSLGRIGAATLALVLSGGALLWMGRQVLLGALTLGDLALFYQAFNKGQGLMRSVLSHLGQIYNNSLFLSNLFEFLKLESQTNLLPADPPPVELSPIQIQQSVRFRNVRFRYPGSDRPVLDQFNLTLPVGKVVAIVGDNGAGKSTLVKLLCRFYDPEAGAIELDGTDIRTFPQAELQRLITVLFQFPIPYFVTAAENIALGDQTVPATAAAIEAAARNAGIHERIGYLPQGYDTLMGKWFPGGVDLSGGEWQRLALARAFFRRAPLIILDEPTSAMDPWAEADWLDRFRQLANGRTALVITHRFTLAMRADVIHVMRQGQIVESGNHQELLQQGGLYAQSWKAQMEACPPAPIRN
ncbi:MAG: ABC transporter ATP-binding protein [Leptolyngbya sp. IPPAS B-1204]|nr:ABC transporter ATP-binding protein [Elainella sp. C42_A2020_010]RNJ70614.1 MAG: ABC transporter ATP-binding protein [Leptolyngbya sp. IPPAS B-1204]